MEYTAEAKSLGLPGVMTWSINRDTNHRMDYSAGECNIFQTGSPDGTFISAIRQVLND